MPNAATISFTSDEPSADEMIAYLRIIARFMPSTRYPENQGELTRLVSAVHGLIFASSHWVDNIQVQVAQRLSVPNYAGLKKTPKSDPLIGTGTGF